MTLYKGNIRRHPSLSLAAEERFDLWIWTHGAFQWLISHVSYNATWTYSSNTLKYTPSLVISRFKRNETMATPSKKIKMDETATRRPNMDLSTSYDVECDICTGTKRKAVKCCLECDVSCCDAHYKTHNVRLPGQNHKIVDIGQAQERICSQHKKPVVLFCQTDKKCVCFLCTEGEHKDHTTAPISEEREKKQVRRKNDF